MLFQPGKLGAAGQLAGILRRVKTQHVHGLPDGDLGSIRLTGGRDRQTAVPYPAFIGQRHVQLTALRRTEDAQAQIGMAGAAALRGQMAGDGGGVLHRPGGGGDVPGGVARSRMAESKTDEYWHTVSDTRCQLEQGRV